MKKFLSLLLVSMLVAIPATMVGCKSAEQKEMDETYQAEREKIETIEARRIEKGINSKPHLVIVGFRDSFDSVLGISKNRFSAEDGVICANQVDTDNGQELERQVIDKVAEKLGLNLNEYYLRLIYDDELGWSEYSSVVYSCDEKENSFGYDSPIEQIDIGVRHIIKSSYPNGLWVADNAPTIVVVADNVSESAIRQQIRVDGGTQAQAKIYVLNK